MIQQSLYQIQEASAYILNSWTLGLRECQLMGRTGYQKYYKDAYRVHYLWGVISSAYELDGVVYVGDTAVGITYIIDTYYKLWHYRGWWFETGLWGSGGTPDAIDGGTDGGGGIIKDGEIPDDNSEPDGGGDIVIVIPPAIDGDDGDGGSDGDGEDGDPGDGGTTIIINTTLEYRAGQVNVVPGVAVVTFIEDGVASPLPDADYILDAYVLSNNGRMQRNLVYTRYASGFTVQDILETGVLHYVAMPIT